MAPASRKEFLDIQANYKVQIHSETPTWHDNNIQSDVSAFFKFQELAKKKKVTKMKETNETKHSRMDQAKFMKYNF